jgi:leucyl aminopeptidase
VKFVVDARSDSSPGELRVVLCRPADRPKDVTEAEFSAAPKSWLRLHDENRLLVGIGQEDPTPASITTAMAVASYAARKNGWLRLHIDLAENASSVEPAVVGALLGGYRFEDFREKKTTPIGSLRISVARTGLASARRAVATGEVIGAATNYARQLGNQPGNHFHPATLAEEAKALAKRSGLAVRVLDERALAAKKFGGILAVGSGSAHPPRLIVLEHRGGPAKQRPIALVGKAITFDSGGISLKPAADMEEMIFDKCGGMAVMGAMSAVAGLGLKRNVVGVIGSAENLPGPNAYRPGDIVHSYDGTTIEIVNTDAEGRVVLADAIAYAREDLRAATIIDLATLTGACGVALGEYAAGLFASDENLKDEILASATRAGEPLWPMPILDGHIEQIRSDVAQWKNSGGRLGGACTAAAFLQAFARETPWAHIDIAYMVNFKKPKGGFAHGATGYGVRLLVDLLRNRA